MVERKIIASYLPHVISELDNIQTLLGYCEITEHLTEAGFSMKLTNTAIEILKSQLEKINHILKY